MAMGRCNVIEIGRGGMGGIVLYDEGRMCV